MLFESFLRKQNNKIIFLSNQPSESLTVRRNDKAKNDCAIKDTEKSRNFAQRGRGKRAISLDVDGGRSRLIERWEKVIGQASNVADSGKMFWQCSKQREIQIVPVLCSSLKMSNKRQFRILTSEILNYQFFWKFRQQQILLKCQKYR